MVYILGTKFKPGLFTSQSKGGETQLRSAASSLNSQPGPRPSEESISSRGLTDGRIDN